MDTIQKRFLLFLFGCMGTRLAFVLTSAHASLYYLRMLGFLAIMPAIGFALIYIGGLRKTGAEVFGDRIWWNSLRPIHSFLYATFAYYAIQGNKNAWKWLALDVIIGLSAFLLFHLKTDIKYMLDHLKEGRGVPPIN